MLLPAPRRRLKVCLRTMQCSVGTSASWLDLDKKTRSTLRKLRREEQERQEEERRKRDNDRMLQVSDGGGLPLAEAEVGRKRQDGDATNGGSPKKPRVTWISEDQIKCLVRESRKRYEGTPQEEYPWLHLFQHAADLLAEDEELCVRSLFCVDVPQPLRDQCCAEMPIYASAGAPPTLLRDVLFCVAHCRYDMSRSSEGKKANPLIAAAENACRGHFRNPTSLRLAKELLVAMLDMGESPVRRPCHLELWDRAFSRRLLTLDELDPLLGQLGGSGRDHVARDPNFVGSLSKALHDYMMHVTARFQLPLPPTLLYKLRGVLLELTEPSNVAATEGLLQDLQTFLLQVLHDDSTALRGPLLSHAFWVIRVASRVVDTLPYVALIGGSGAGKTSFLNSVCRTQLRAPGGGLAEEAYQRHAQDFRGGMLFQSESKYSALEFALESTGAEDVDFQSNRSEHLDKNFPRLVKEALKAHDDDPDKRQHGLNIVASWIDWEEGRRESPPSFLLPIKPSTQSSCTACTTILWHAPVVCAGLWYKTRESLHTQALQLCLRVFEAGEASSADVLHDLLESILGTRLLPTDPPLSIRQWLAACRSDKPSRDCLCRDLHTWMSQVPEATGWRRLSIEPLALAVGKGDSLAEDLGHVARWIARMQDPSENELVVFLDEMYVGSPLPLLKSMGACFADPPGSGDMDLLRVEHARHALPSAEVLVHITAANAACLAADADLLRPFWKSFLPAEHPDFKGPKKFLWNVMRGPSAHPEQARRTALEAYATHASRHAGVDPLAYSQQADIRVEMVDYSSTADQDNSNTHLCDILSKCGKSAKQSTYEAIASRLESVRQALGEQLSVLQTQDLARMATIMHKPEIIEALGEAARDELQKLTKEVCSDVEAGVARIKVKLTGDAEHDQEYRLLDIMRDLQPVAIEKLTPRKLESRLAEMSEDGRLIVEEMQTIHDGVLKQLGLAQTLNASGEPQKRFTQAICAELEQKLLTFSFDSDDVGKVIALLRHNAEHNYIPFFDQVRIKVNRAGGWRALTDFKRRLKCMLRQESPRGGQPPARTQEHLWEYLDKYVQEMRSGIISVLRLGRSGLNLEPDITALLEDFRPQDPESVKSATTRVCKLQELIDRLAEAFKESASPATPQPSQVLDS